MTLDHGALYSHVVLISSIFISKVSHTGAIPDEGKLLYASYARGTSTVFRVRAQRDSKKKKKKRKTASLGSFSRAFLTKANINYSVEA